ncbi:acyl-CoA N-acyltransferase [Pasteurella canis]|uniref:Acyl-CoA N-acyltransferase n=1 Tax=Pasteurella canis TaxID=753 RepID=A0A379ESE6_9PAST|nr:acyl-CoA N-acyltransferase [Pasteurella canis]
MVKDDYFVLKSYNSLYRFNKKCPIVTKMKIFKAEQWNLDILLPLFEQYRLSHGMLENPDRTLAFLTNRIRLVKAFSLLQ